MGRSPIEAARVRHRLAEVAARTGVELMQITGSVTVRCPLPSHGHVDHTPSLRLYLDDDIFFCFGCGAKGDVVEWVCRTERVGWREAIDLLGSGRPLTNAWGTRGARVAQRPHSRPSTHGRAASPRHETEAPDLSRTPPARVHAALEAAWGYYTYPPLRYRGEDYLRERGIDAVVLEAYTGRPEVGHTPAKADGLVNSLRSRGFSDDELVDAGLAHRRLGDGALVDFYRQRVLVPIRDDQDHIVGIIGRNVGDQGRFPKYKNPPRTVVYDKSVNLYQPLPAPTDPRGQVVVVEGTLDAMAIAVAAIRTDQASRFCPVTQSGRELSAVQLARVIDMHGGVPVLGFDGDPAGQDSAYRHALAAVRQGRAVTVTILPDDHDPASWLAERGGDGLSAWMPGGALEANCKGPEPLPAATYVASYLATQPGANPYQRSAPPRRNGVGIGPAEASTPSTNLQVAL